MGFFVISINMTDVSNEWQITFKNTALIECFKRHDVPI